MKEFRNGFFFCPAISFSCRALGGYFSRTPIDAIGVAFKSVAYNLVGHEDIEGADTVVVSEIDGGQELKSHQTTIEGLIRTILEG